MFFNAMEFVYGVLRKVAWLLQYYVILIGLAWAVVLNPTGTVGEYIFGSRVTWDIKEFMESSNYVYVSILIWFSSIIFYIFYWGIKLTIEKDGLKQKNAKCNIFEASVAVVAMLFIIMLNKPILYIPVELIVIVQVALVIIKFVCTLLAMHMVLRTRYFGSWKLVEESVTEEVK